MKRKDKSPKNHIPYIRAVPEVLRYQLLTKLILALLLFGAKQASLALLNSTGRVAVSSGDYGFLFVTWQGWLMILLFLTVFFLYTAIDLNVKILYSADLVTGKSESLRHVMLRGGASVRKFFSLSGLGVVLYVSLIAPIVGVGFSISLTEGLKIPNFITAVITNSMILNTLYTVVVIVFALIGILYIFTLHGVLLDGMKVRAAQRQSLSIIRHNPVSFILQHLLYLICAAAPMLLILGGCLWLPLYLLELLNAPFIVNRFLTVLILIIGGTVYVLISLFPAPYYILKITTMYYKYTSPDLICPVPPERHSWHLPKWVKLAVPILLLALTVGITAGFDQLFPSEVRPLIIAHRGGGNEGSENTVSGLKKAIELGAYGSEIDIQRTSDGYYVVNHDSTFSRVAGVRKNVTKMTLAEVKALRLRDGESVASFGEMLEAAKDKIILFVELKGSSADKRMCDDAVRMIKAKGMEEQAVLISLKYNVIDYIETTYPEMHTGYLTFLSYGNTAKLNCDYIGLEEESATASAVNSVHRQGKKLLIWTVNDEEAQAHFLATQADAIITDNVVQAQRITEELKDRNDLQRVISVLRQI